MYPINARHLQPPLIKVHRLDRRRKSILGRSLMRLPFDTRLAT
jgi:hypothetical protein